MYEIGDSVKCIDEYDDNYRIRNRVGKVIDIEDTEDFGPRPIVQFRTYIGGHDGNGKGEQGYCWRIPCELLRPRHEMPIKGDHIQIKGFKDVVQDINYDDCTVIFQSSKTKTFKEVKGFKLVARQNILAK